MLASAGVLSVLAHKPEGHCRKEMHLLICACSLPPLLRPPKAKSNNALLFANGAVRRRGRLQAQSLEKANRPWHCATPQETEIEMLR